MTLYRNFMDALIALLVAGLIFGWVDRDPLWMGWVWVAVAVAWLLSGISMAVKTYGSLYVLRAAAFVLAGVVVAIIAFRIGGWPGFSQ